MASLAGGAPISIGQLAQVTVTKQPTVTRLLDRMEAREQVERLPMTVIGVSPWCGSRARARRL